MTYELICEGRCNPTIGSVDAMVENLNRRSLETGVSSRCHPAWKYQRQLIHTPHDMIASDRAVCLICRHERRFGGDTATARSVVQVPVRQECAS